MPFKIYLDSSEKNTSWRNLKLIVTNFEFTYLLKWFYPTEFFPYPVRLPPLTKWASWEFWLTFSPAIFPSSLFFAASSLSFAARSSLCCNSFAVRSSLCCNSFTAFLTINASGRLSAGTYFTSVRISSHFLIIFKQLSKFVKKQRKTLPTEYSYKTVYLQNAIHLRNMGQKWRTSNVPKWETRKILSDDPLCMKQLKNESFERTSSQ